LDNESWHNHIILSTTVVILSEAKDLTCYPEQITCEACSHCEGSLKILHYAALRSE